MSDLCSMCLSSDRKLETISNTDHVSRWLNIQVNPEDQVCWECAAIISRMSMFRSQVLKAQNVIKVIGTRFRRNIKRLSTLRYTSIETYDYSGIDDKGNQDTSNVKTETKHVEILFKNEPDDSDNSNSEFLHQDITTEPPYKTEEVIFYTDPLHEGIAAKDKSKKKRKNILLDVQSLLSQMAPSILCSDIGQSQPSTSNRKCMRKMKTESSFRNAKDTGRYLKKKTAEEKEKKGWYVIKQLTEEELNEQRNKKLHEQKYVEALFKCSSCIIMFTSVEFYNKHVKERHSGDESCKDNLCSVCHQTFSSEPSLKRHYSEHFVNYTCSRCGEVKNSVGSVYWHYKMTHETNNVYECEVQDCNATFDTYKLYRQHSRQAHQKYQDCAHCGKTYKNAYRLRLHVREIHETESLTRPYICPICSKTFRTKSNLALHSQSHEPGRHYCVECDRTFKRLDTYQKHLMTKLHNTEKDLKFECDYCGTKLSSKPSIEYHIINVHIKKYPFTCKLCSKEFARKTIYKRHVRLVHDRVPDPKNKICAHCGKGFATNAMLRNHERVHTGEKPFKCHLCEWSFAAQSTLRTHLRGKHKMRMLGKHWVAAAELDTVQNYVNQ